MTADIKRGLTGGRGRGLQRSVSSVSGLSPRARPICGVRAVTGVYRYSVQVQFTGVQVSVQGQPLPSAAHQAAAVPRQARHHRRPACQQKLLQCE